MSESTRTLPFDRPEPLQPPPAYAELRAHEPVAKVLTSDGRPAWLVTSYDAVATVSGTPTSLAPSWDAPAGVIPRRGCWATGSAAAWAGSGPAISPPLTVRVAPGTSA